MATIFQVFDLREAARSGAKQQVLERRYFDGGFEAPRNSLDVPYEAADVSRSATVFKGEDIPFGYEYFNPAVAAGVRRTQKGVAARSLSHGNSPRQSENRKRAPNVVARLMGLEALPDELPTRKHSLPSTPTHGSPLKPVRGNPGLTRQRSQGAVPSSWQRPPLPRHVQRAPATGEEERVSAPVLPFRDHPQEEQLRKFKKEFEAKQQAALAKKQEQLRTLQLRDMNRELEEKKEKVRATLDKAKSALSQGIVAQEPKRLSAQGQFEESKEFLDAMEFLQSNKDLIFKFLQQKPQVAGKNGNSNTATPVTLLKSVKKGKGNALSPGARKRDGFSPRALARLIMNPRKWNDSKQQPATPLSDIVSQPSASAQPAAIDRGNGSGSRRASTEERELSDSVMLRSSSFTNSRSELRAPPSPEVQSKPPRDVANVPNKGGSRDVIMKIMERLRQKEQCGRTGEKTEKERFLREQAFRRDSNDIARTISENARESSQSRNNFTLTEYLSTGRRVSIHLEDMDDVRYTSDGEDSSTPLIKTVRENAIKRSSISLPSSPHLSTRCNDDATSSKVMRKRGAIEKHGTPPAATHKEAKKTTLTSETPRRRQGRGSLLSNTEVENSLRKSASFNENASQSEDLKQGVEASAATISRRCLQDQKKEPASSLTRSRSIPNMALLRKRGKFANEAVQKLGSSGACQSDKSSEGKSTAKSIPENTPKHRLCQQAEKTKGFFGGRKKIRDGSVAMPSVQNVLFPSTTPVLARFAALAESCVSQGNTLSDADNAVDVKLRVRLIGNAGSKKGKENSRVQVLPAKKESTSKMFGEPSLQAEIESVVSESSAHSDADSCDDDFLEALAHLRPLAKTTAESVVAGDALPSTVFVPRVHQQVHNLKKSPDPPRDWTGQFNISNRVDDELDSNGDNNGQPSPVSVLEAPFEEESPSVEFEEIADSLKDLRLRLNLLKDEGGERTEDGLEHIQEMAHTPRLERQHQFLDSARGNQTLTDLQQRKTNATKTHRQFATTASPNQQAIPCLAVQEADLAFVANVLVGSDFITHGGRLISKWHSATQPISPSLCVSLEASHYSGYKGSANRRILFDAVNDILAAKLRPLCYEPWTSSHSSGAVVRTGRRLVADVWNEICKRQFPAALCHNDLHDDYLESLVAQDLKSSTTWMSLHHDVHGICLQLEKSIFNSLITELCADLLIV